MLEGVLHSTLDRARGESYARFIVFEHELTLEADGECVRILDRHIILGIVAFLEAGIELLRLEFGRRGDILDSLLYVEQRNLALDELIHKLSLVFLILDIGLGQPSLSVEEDGHRTRAYLLSALEVSLEGGEVEAAEGRLVVKDLVVVLHSGKTVVNVQTVVEVVGHVGRNEADVIGEHSVVVLIEVGALAVRLVEVVVSLLRILGLALEVLGAGEGEDDLAVGDVGVEVHVITELDVEAVAAEEELEDLELRIVE